MRKKIVQRSRPWEKAPTYIKAQELKAQERKNSSTAKGGRGRRQAAAASA